MIGQTVSANEKKWQRECDARTLADAAAIRSDSKRYAEAKKAAKTMAPEMMEESKMAVARAKALARIGNSKK